MLDFHGRLIQCCVKQPVPTLHSLTETNQLVRNRDKHCVPYCVNSAYDSGFKLGKLLCERSLQKCLCVEHVVGQCYELIYEKKKKKMCRCVLLCRNVCLPLC